MFGAFFDFHQFLLLIAFVYGDKLLIEPDAKVITKYEGDSINLTCSYEDERNNDKERFSSLDVLTLSTSNPTLNWILPSNGQNRVRVKDEKGKVSLLIEDLTESDHGNYTCHSIAENNNLLKSSSIYLAVLPRGKMSSCNPKSFFCDKTVCIPDRYECDGIPDCLNGLDEAPGHCGPDPCFGKLSCEDKRCLSPHECCIESSKSPPNCTISPSIRCCRQLIHPALLDQDLYFLASRPNVNKEIMYYHTAISLIIVGFMLLIACITIAVVFSIRYRFCRLMTTSQGNWHQTPSWNVCNTQRILGPSQQHPTDQYLLQSSTGGVFDRSGYIRRIPGLRSDLFSPNVLRSQNVEDSTIVLVPISHSGIDCGPPPSYQQVIGAPPPPYTTDADLGSSLLSTVSSTSALYNTAVSSSNNNNGDINGNMTSRHSVAQNRNFSDIGNNNNNNTTTSISSSSLYQPLSSGSQNSPQGLFSSSGPSGFGFLHRK
ncbi:UNVERIFIED_CONTAM: hypothetical protein RMT77_005149 [Armadillidium vulgare]